MHCIRFATVLSLGILASSVRSAEPGGLSASEQQRELVEAQRADDSHIDQISELKRCVEFYRSRGCSYRDSSALRKAMDQLNYLQRSRDARAAQYLKLINVTQPLAQPLTQKQIDELQTIDDIFPNTPASKESLAVRNEHEKLREPDDAKQMLATANSNSPENVLVNQPVVPHQADQTQFWQAATYIIDFLTSNVRFSEPKPEKPPEPPIIIPHEKVARQRLNEAIDLYHAKHDKAALRTTLAEIVLDYPETEAAQLLVPIKAEELANQELLTTFDNYGGRKDKSDLRKALADIVIFYPKTEAVRLLAAGNSEQLARQQLDRAFERHGDQADKTQLRHALADIVEFFPKTEAARSLTPSNPEQLARQHRDKAHERYGRGRDNQRLQLALTDVVELFPKTEVAQQVKTVQVELQKIINAQAEQSRMIREYWDSVYPSRVRKPPQSQSGPAN